MIESWWAFGKRIPRLCDVVWGHNPTVDMVNPASQIAVAGAEDGGLKATQVAGTASASSCLSQFPKEGANPSRRHLCRESKSGRKWEARDKDSRDRRTRNQIPRRAGIEVGTPER